MKIELEPEALAEVVGPLLRAVAGQLAQEMVATAAVLAEDAEQGYRDKAWAMKYLDVDSERTLENWMKPVNEGGRGLPHHKIGATVKFKRARIDAWMLTMERNTPPILRPLEHAA